MLIELNVIKLEEKETAMAKLVKVCQVLSEQGFKFNDFEPSKKINQKTYFKTLQDIVEKYPNINLEEVIEKTGVDINYKIGQSIRVAKQVANGTIKMKITEEEKKILVDLGVIKLEKESVIGKLVKVCQALAKQGFDFKKFKYTGKMLADIAKEYPNINIEAVMNETGVDCDYRIGNYVVKARQMVNGTIKEMLMEDDEEKILRKLGVISEKETAMEKLVKVCQALAKQGFEFDKFAASKTVENKNYYKRLKDIAKEYKNINIEDIMNETGVDCDYQIGSIIIRARQAVNNKTKAKTPLTEEEKKILVDLGVIKLEKESVIGKLVKVCQALAKQGFDFGKFKYTGKALADIAIEYPNINIEAVMNETGVDLDYEIGRYVFTARRNSKSNN